ncbi:MAG TPA: thiamine pyrophosphate-dependent dehydrogenase E1 component subunit alpha [Candidatus Limnocylindria bacterium]|nr:thiamine pyrophosphate-dependent dehydrogenase E1 component subunit alpha [Candidatus Limnocylindria bacterium]
MLYDVHQDVDRELAERYEWKVAEPARGDRVVSGDLARRLLATMWLCRAFEEKVSELIASGAISGLVHLAIGQEGTAAAICEQLDDGDLVFSGHRAHGHALAKGADPSRVLAEIAGRATGLCGGKGGSMHLVDVAHGFLGATGVVGGNVPNALGVALAQKQRATGRVTVVFFGDGAAQAGHFLESLNLASLWELPVVLVCENNGYAEFTPRSAHTNVERVATLAKTYGIATATVEGNDALAVHTAAAPFIARAREGKGPALLECLTYRMRGHYEGDAVKYRESAELDAWRAKDPLRILENRAVAKDWFDDGAARAIETAARALVDKAAAFALASPWPDASALAQDVR